MKDVIWAGNSDFAVEYYERRANVTETALFDYDESLTPGGERILKMDGGEAVISVAGPLSQNGPDRFDLIFGYGGTGYTEIMEALDIVESNGATSLKLLMDTPGGEAVGAVAVYDKLYEMRRKGVEVTAVNLRVLASAGYLIAAAAETIEATTVAAMTGAIGIVLVGLDYSEARKDYGVKKVVLRSANAPDKNPDIADSEGQKKLLERLDALERIYYDKIAQGRGIDVEKAKADFGRGGEYVAIDPDVDKPDAVSVKMIDGVRNVNSPMRGQTDEGEENMGKTLKELMAGDAGLKAEVDEMVRNAEQAGADRVEARVKKASAFIGNSDYPGAIQALAGKVCAGEEEVAALTGAVTMYDAMKESGSLKAAQDEQPEDTPADAPEVPAGKSGVEIENPETLAEMDRAAMKGE